VPDEGLRDAGLEQGTRGGETGTLGNAEVAGDLEQDRPAFAVRDELFLLVGGAVRAFASAARAPVSRWRSSRRYSSRFFHSPARLCRSVARIDI